MDSIEDIASSGDAVPKRKSAKLRDSLKPKNPLAVDSPAYKKSRTNSKTVRHADESDSPQIGIYKQINGVLQGKDNLHGGGKGRKESLASDDGFDGVRLDVATKKQKRRAKTDKDSVFDVPQIEDTPKRKKYRTALQPKTQGSAKSQLGKKSDGPKRRSDQAKEKDKPTKTGKFEQDEIAVIAIEMMKYREDHDSISEVELNQLVQGDATLARGLWNQLCDELPERDRQAVMKFCRRKYHNYGARGKWTDIEDGLLRDAYEMYPKAWKKIGGLLNRHPEDSRDRWRNYLICGDKQNKAVWAEDEEDSLRYAVGECLEAIRELRVANGLDPSTPEMELVDWQMVSQKLNHTRSRLQCMTKWKSLAARDDSENGAANDLDIAHSSWRVAAAKRDYRDMDSQDKLSLLYAIQQSSSW